MKLKNKYGNKTVTARAYEMEKELLLTLKMDDSPTRYGGDALLGLDEILGLHEFLEDYLIEIGEIEVEELPDSLAETEMCGCVVEPEPLPIQKILTKWDREIELEDAVRWNDDEGKIFLRVKPLDGDGSFISSGVPFENVKEMHAFFNQALNPCSPSPDDLRFKTSWGRQIVLKDRRRSNRFYLEITDTDNDKYVSSWLPVDTAEDINAYLERIVAKYSPKPSLEIKVERPSFLERYGCVGPFGLEEGCLTQERATPKTRIEFIETDISRKFELTDYRDGSAHMIISEVERCGKSIHSMLPRETVEQIVEVIKAMKEGDSEDTVIDTGCSRRISFEDTFRTGFHIDVKEKEWYGKTVFANVFGVYAEHFMDFFLRIDREVFEPERKAAKIEELEAERKEKVARIYDIDSEILGLRI